ncbi:MAG: tRNA guanosine(34) transglycosylase Tgt [Candidatus Jacksonbacteria bacterium]
MPKPFQITHQSKASRARVGRSRQRAGRLKTAHGIIETPVFMPVATQAVFKGGVDIIDAQNIKAPIILANTYHLYLRGAVPIIKKAGGLHKFMQWDKPILTDSGGFQVWSLGLGARKDQLCKIDDEGVNFTSHLDGKQHRLTPEKAVQIQLDLGADIIMAFDEATPDTASYDYTKRAMIRTHKWAERCFQINSKLHVMPTWHGKTQNRQSQLLFGIVQGGRFKKLRQESARVIGSLGFDGIAIGGESIGYNMKRTGQILEYLAPYLPRDKPLYTMGVGASPLDFFKVVEHGADMFDCVAPARMARHGSLYSRQTGRKNNYRLNILNAKFKQDFGPVCDWCDCAVCQNYSRAFLRHLFKSEELTALRLASIHNLRFMLRVMEEIRIAIKGGWFEKLQRQWL